MDTLKPDSTALRQVSFIRARDPSILPNRLSKLAKIKKNIFDSLEEETFYDNNSSVIDCDRDADNDVGEDTTIVEDNREPEPEEDGGIQVYLRVRESEDHAEDFSIHGNELVYETQETAPTSSRTVKNPGVTLKKFCFTEIFEPETRQIEIFDSVVKHRVLEFINGKNSSLFTYGASGAGKTFTIVGNADEPGLIPRALEYLFRTLPELPDVPSIKPLCNNKVNILDAAQQESEKDTRKQILEAIKGPKTVQHIETYNAMRARLSKNPVGILEEVPDVSIGVWVTFAEIYNEEITDLLDDSKNLKKQKLQVGASFGNAYIKNLTHVNVSNGLQAYQVFQYGIQKLKYAETGIHDHSSRSHSIFSIKIVQAPQSGEDSSVSTFSFCDLAGSERSKKTMNIGKRLKESNSINTSLLVLGRCIAALRKLQKNPNSHQLIPFRESKLTQLFQKALNGLEDFCFIININISKKMLEETLNVLNFSAIAKELTSGQAQAEVKANLNSTIVAYDKMNLKLANELAVLEERYDQLLREKKEVYRMEEQEFRKLWTEILEDSEKFWKEKTERMIQKHESMFTMRLNHTEKLWKEKSDRANKRRERTENNYYKKKCARNEEILDELVKQKTELNERLNKLNEEAESNEETINQLRINVWNL